MEDLNLCLKANGLALHVLPAIQYQSLGGVIATSSHGSRWDMGTMSAAVLEMTLILANGDVWACRPWDRFFPAVQVPLGCLGIIHSVKLQCVDLFLIYHRRAETVWSKVLPNIGDYLQKYLFWQCYINPDVETLDAVMYLRSITAETAKVGEKREQNVNEVDEKVDYSMYVLTRNEEASFYTEIEVGIPVELLEPAVSDTIKLIQSYRKKYTDWNYEKKILLRFTAADDSYLSMTAGRDTVFIDIYQDAQRVKDPISNDLFRDFQKLLINSYQGRPHWGKFNELTPEIVTKVYGDYPVTEFNKVRDALDPKHVFTNDYIRGALG